MEFESKTVQLLRELSSKYNLTINDDAFQEYDTKNPTNLAVLIGKLFPDRTTGYLLEQGSPPSEYYSPLILSYAETTGKEFNPENIEVYSDDDWETASVNFIINDQLINFKIQGVENSDWVSSFFGRSMTDFAKENLSGTWIEFIGEDWCTALYIPKEGIEDFKQVQKELMKVDLDTIVDLCREGDPDYQLAELLATGIENINTTSSRGELALNVAIKSGNTDKLWILSEQGQPCLNPQAKDKNGQSAFDIANELGLKDVIDELNDYAEDYELWLEKQKNNL